MATTKEEAAKLLKDFHPLTLSEVEAIYRREMEERVKSTMLNGRPMAETTAAMLCRNVVYWMARAQKAEARK